MYEKCYNARRETSKYFYILQGVAQGCTLSPTLFKVFINDMIRAVETTKQGVKVGEDMVSGSGVSRNTGWTAGTNREGARIH